MHPVIWKSAYLHGEGQIFSQMILLCRVWGREFSNLFVANIYKDCYFFLFKFLWISLIFGLWTSSQRLTDYKVTFSPSHVFCLNLCDCRVYQQCCYLPCKEFFMNVLRIWSDPHEAALRMSFQREISLLIV